LLSPTLTFAQAPTAAQLIASEALTENYAASFASVIGCGALT
jgi:hypothetical protein